MAGHNTPYVIDKLSSQLDHGAAAVLRYLKHCN
jgi:hypothetical protein